MQIGMIIRVKLQRDKSLKDNFAVSFKDGFATSFRDGFASFKSLSVSRRAYSLTLTNHDVRNTDGLLNSSPAGTIEICNPDNHDMSELSAPASTIEIYSPENHDMSELGVETALPTKKPTSESMKTFSHNLPNSVKSIKKRHSLGSADYAIHIQGQSGNDSENGSQSLRNAPQLSQVAIKATSMRSLDQSIGFRRRSSIKSVGSIEFTMDDQETSSSEEEDRKSITLLQNNLGSSHVAITGISERSLDQLIDTDRRTSNRSGLSTKNVGIAVVRDHQNSLKMWTSPSKQIMGLQRRKSLNQIISERIVIPRRRPLLSSRSMNNIECSPSDDFEKLSENTSKSNRIHQDYEWRDRLMSVAKKELEEGNELSFES
jgi:hypothetical protein